MNNSPPPAPPANEYSSKDTKLIRKALANYKKKDKKSKKGGISSKVRSYLNQRTPSNITRATGEYTLKIAKLRFPKGYHNPIPERYDTIPIEYLKPSFLVPRYQQDQENEKLKQRKQSEQEELADESSKGILNAKNVIW
jgi:hypothetical protein